VEDLMNVVNPVTASAILLGALWVTVVVWFYSRQRRDRLPLSTPDAKTREAAAKALWQAYPAFPDDEPDTALFLLEESRREYDGWVESNARIEGKATWLTGFIAGGAGLLTVFGSGQGENGQLQPGPFLYLAIAGAIGAVVSCLYVVRPKLRPHPSASAYVAPAVAFASKARFHLALSLAEEYNRASVTLARSRRFDPVAWASAQGFVILGIFAILIHFGVNLKDRHPDPSVVQCRVQVGQLRSAYAAKIYCEDLHRAR
jgi:hypothetical protein